MQQRLSGKIHNTPVSFRGSSLENSNNSFFMYTSAVVLIDFAFLCRGDSSSGGGYDGEQLGRHNGNVLMCMLFHF